MEKQKLLVKLKQKHRNPIVKELRQRGSSTFVPKNAYKRKPKHSKPITTSEQLHNTEPLA